MAEQMMIIAGLGNPGDKYTKTRHNIGFEAVNYIADKNDISLSKNKYQAQFGKGKIDNFPVIIAKPLSYMNRSGAPLRQIADYFNLPPEQMIIIYDDIDLLFGRIKIKENGGHGGHNGVRSIIQTFGTKEISRIKIGVGRPDITNDVSNHVLGRFSSQETDTVNEILPIVSDAVSTILSKGITQAMNNFNCFR